MNIVVEQISTRYKISCGNYSIFVEKQSNGRINIKTSENNREFVFQNSKSESIEMVASLLIEASKI